MLDHLADGVSHVSGIEYLHAGHFESSHRNFKRHYQNTSRRKHYAMYETLESKPVLEESEE